jgi:hypothetical protein
MQVLTIGALLIGGPAIAQSGAPAALAEDFESTGGPVQRALLRDSHLAIAEGEGVGGGRALRATYVGGEMGSERIVRILPLRTAGIEFTLNYDVRFARGFQFVLGGKLHGLGPRRQVSGGERIRPDGWSARVMWRENGAASTYTYHQDQRDRFGDYGMAARPFAFAPDRYYAVSLHVRLNDPADRANGFVRLYVDGSLTASQENLRLRATGDRASLISTFLFSTFHGGGDPAWAPRAPGGGYAEVQAYFDNLSVYPGERIRAVAGAR